MRSRETTAARPAGVPADSGCQALSAASSGDGDCLSRLPASLGAEPGPGTEQVLRNPSRMVESSGVQGGVEEAAGPKPSSGEQVQLRSGAASESKGVAGATVLGKV